MKIATIAKPSTPKLSLRPPIRSQHAEDLDGADDYGHEHRDQRDVHVVVELAHRLHERPAVRAEHEDAVGRIEQRHTDGEEQRKDQDVGDRHAFAGLQGRDPEHAHLGRRIEAEPEEHPQRVHLPARPDQSEQGFEKAAHQPALGQERVECAVAIRLPAPHRAERREDVAEDEHVEDRDRKQKALRVVSRPAAPSSGRQLLTLSSPGSRVFTTFAAIAIATVRPMTIVEWPSEKNKPTATGRFPSCISLRVTLSMAEM